MKIENRWATVNINLILCEVQFTLMLITTQPVPANCYIVVNNKKFTSLASSVIISFRSLTHSRTVLYQKHYTFYNGCILTKCFADHSTVKIQTVVGWTIWCTHHLLDWCSQLWTTCTVTVDGRAVHSPAKIYYQYIGHQSLSVWVVFLEVQEVGRIINSSH